MIGLTNKSKKFLSTTIFALVFVPLFFSAVGIKEVGAQAGVGAPDIAVCESPEVLQNGVCVDPSGKKDKDYFGIKDAFVWALGQFVNTTFLSTVGPILLLVSGSILGLAGVVFNQAIEFSILSMSSGGLEAIDVGWALFRDMINMGLIFVLLYISIGTILGLGGFATQKTIGNVILVALFINFSLFATRLIIDVSNVLAVGMYNNIQNSQNLDTVATSEVTGGVGDAQESFKTSNVGLSGAIMRPLVLTFVYNPAVNEGTTSSLAGALWGGTKGAVANIIADPWKIFVTTIMGSVMMLIAAFVFFAGSIMFLTRYVVLLFVMVASPLAFGSLAFPGGKKFFDQWLGYLTNYAFFAPVYLFLLYFVAYFLNNSNIIKAEDNFSIIINFVIAMIMMLTALIASSKFGIAGSKFATKMAGAATFGLTARLGRNTVGRLGYQITQDKNLQEKAARGDVTAKAMLFTAGKASTSSFDARQTAPIAAMGKFAGGFGEVNKTGTKGYAEVRKKKIEAAEKYAKDVIGATGSDEEKAIRRGEYAASLARPTFYQKLAAKMVRTDDKGKLVEGLSDITGYASDLEASEKIAKAAEKELNKAKIKEHRQNRDRLRSELKSLEEKKAQVEKTSGASLNPDHPVALEMKIKQDELEKLEGIISGVEEELEKEKIKKVVTEETKGFKKSDEGDGDKKPTEAPKP